MKLDLGELISLKDAGVLKVRDHLCLVITYGNTAMRLEQYGESPNPAKRSEQPVLSLGAVEPLSGESFFLTMPNCDTECTNIFLEKLSEQYPDDIILLVCDGAAWHKSKALRCPESVLWDSEMRYSTRLMM